MKHLILLLAILLLPAAGFAQRERLNDDSPVLNYDSFDFMNTMIKEKNHSPSQNHINHSSDNRQITVQTINKQQINNQQLK
jgi:hypothetical protein